MDFIYNGIGWLLSLFNSWTGNYVLALLIFAVFAKVILLPLDIKQQKNSIKQAKLRPKEMAIRNKYKGRTDRATQMKLQQEIQDLYQREGYSMFGGCLPMLIQFPIIIILYGVIRNPLQYIMGWDLEAVVKPMAEILNELKGVSTFTTQDQISMLPAIKELAGTDGFVSAMAEKIPEFSFNVADLPNFNVFGIDTGYSPQQYTEIAGTFFNIMLLIPVLNFVMQFVTTKLLKKFQPQPVVDDPSQKTSMNIMELTLPLMTVYFAFIMNGAIGIYWMFNNVLSLVERLFISIFMPLPQYTEEEIKQIQKAMKKDSPAARPERREGEKPRSLHRIDEDDDDVPAPQPKKNKAKADEDEEEKAPTAEEQKNAAIADKVIGKAPALKDESDKYNRKKK